VSLATFEVFPLVKVEVSDSGGFKPFVIHGQKLTRDNPIELPVVAALLRLSDRNLKITFEEGDRKELMAIDPEHFSAISLELSKKITTHNELAGLLLPKKGTKKKSTATKAKKSSLTDE
tara:strand:- start:645 stop:1001 length:357 start_codon:yes stop_codon:yes gene_type:complete